MTPGLCRFPDTSASAWKEQAGAAASVVAGGVNGCAPAYELTNLRDVLHHRLRPRASIICYVAERGPSALVLCLYERGPVTVGITSCHLLERYSVAGHLTVLCSIQAQWALVRTAKSLFLCPHPRACRCHLTAPAQLSKSWRLQLRVTVSFRPPHCSAESDYRLNAADILGRLGLDPNYSQHADCESLLRNAPTPGNFGAGGSGSR